MKIESPKITYEIEFEQNEKITFAAVKALAFSLNFWYNIICIVIDVFSAKRRTPPWILHLI